MFAPPRSRRSRGCSLALAFACKQTTAILVAPVLLARLLREPRSTLVLGSTFLVPTLIAHFWLQHATDGWYGFYVYEVPAAHPWFPGSWLGFWEEDVLRGLPVVFALGLGSALALGRRGRRAERELLLLLLGALIASYLSRLHYGGWRNTVLPFWAFAALAGARGFAALRARPEAGRYALLAPATDVGAAALASSPPLGGDPRRRARPPVATNRIAAPGRGKARSSFPTTARCSGAPAIHPVRTRSRSGTCC